MTVQRLVTWLSQRSQDFSRDYSQDTGQAFTASPVTFTTTQGVSLTAVVATFTASAVSTALVAANQSPLANDDEASTAEDVSVMIFALANDIDVDGAALSALLVTGPSHGAVTLNLDRSFRYAPAIDFNGSNFFTYRANDGTSNSNIATVRIRVTAINDAPQASPDSFSVAEDGQLIIAASGLLANDSAGPASESGQTLRVISIAGGATAHRQRDQLYSRQKLQWPGELQLHYSK